MTSRLRDADALVVLDACEHVLDEAARIASTLLAECPRVRILATSREALHVASEVRLPVAPLEARGRRALPRACARGTARIRAGRRGRRARRRDRPARGRAAARDRARRRARERARARGARLHPRAPRGAPARQPGLRPEPAPRCKSSWNGATTSCTGTRRRCSSSSPSTAAARRSRRSSRSQRRTASTRRPSRISSPRWSTSRSCRPRSRAAPPATTCSTPSASTCSSVSPRAAGSPPRARAHAEYFAALAEEARVELRGPEWLRWERRLELENDNLWAALAYARDAPDPAVAVRLGTLGWYFALAERVSEGRRFLELALVCHGRRRSGRVADRAARRPLLPRDRRARSRRRARGGRTRALARRDRCGAVAAAGSRN